MWGVKAVVLASHWRYAACVCSHLFNEGRRAFNQVLYIFSSFPILSECEQPCLFI